MKLVHNRFLFETRRWLTSCLLFLYCSCQQEKRTEAGIEITRQQQLEMAQKVIRAAEFTRIARDSIRPGDMITRTGNDFTSFCLRQFCQTDKTYSHCGIASIENDTVFVYHALGGEFNPDQQLLREPLAFFVAPAANNGFALFRFAITEAQNKKLLEAVNEAYRQKIPFDMQFDLDTDEKMYCSEFTAKMYRRALGNDTLFVPSRIMNFGFLAPDNLFTHPLCRRIYEARY